MRDAWRIEIVRVLSKIAQHLQTLQIVLQSRDKENTAKPENQETKASQPEPQPLPTPSRIEVIVPESLTGQLETNQRQKQRQDGRRYRLDLAVLFTLMLTLVGVFLQWWSMNDTLKEMQSQTQPMIDAAKAAGDAVTEAVESRKQAAKALDASIESSQLDQRAWVGVVEMSSPQYSGVHIKEGERLDFYASITNTGRTPARKADLLAGIKTLPSGEEFRPTYTTLPKSLGLIQPQARIRIPANSSPEAAIQPRISKGTFYGILT